MNFIGVRGFVNIYFLIYRILGIIIEDGCVNGGRCREIIVIVVVYYGGN